MSPNLRRGLAFILAVITMAVLMLWTARGWVEIRYFAHRHGLLGLAVGPHADPQAGTGPTSGDMEGAFAFYMILLGALVLAGGCAAALLVLRSLTGFRRRIVIYIALLAAILPASLYNYSHAEGDVALRAQYQVILNLGMIFLGSTICWAFKDWNVEALDARVLKIMLFVLVLFSAVLTPGFLTFMWFLWRFGILSAETGFVPIEWMGTVAGLASVAIAYLQYKQGQPRATTDSPPSVREV
jgi:hypothetical protein